MMFHRHKWKVVSQTEQQSRVEVAGAHGYKITAKRADVRELGEIFVRPVIVRYVCDCGAEKVARI